MVLHLGYCFIKRYPTNWGIHCVMFLKDAFAGSIKMVESVLPQ